MKMLPKLGVCLLLLGIIALVACEKENNNPTTQVVENKSQFFKGVTFKDDHLTFKHEGYIQLIIEALAKDREGTIKNLSQQFPAFKSNLSASLDIESKIEQNLIKPSEAKNYEHLITVVKENGENVVERTVSSAILAAISNENGFFEIGKTLYKINRDFLIEYDAISKKEIKRNKVKRQEIIQDDRQVNADADLPYTCGGKMNLKARLYIIVAGVYSEGGSVARNSKPALIGWSKSSVSSISLNSSFVLERFSVTSFSKKKCFSQTFTTSQTKTNSSEIEFVAAPCWGCCGDLQMAPPSTSTSSASNCGFKTITVNL